MEKKQNTLINKLFSKYEIREISYRKDINFLRAVAIISVLIYHFDKKLFPGGWLGVDLFFFISGYLIVNKIIIGFSTEKSFFKKFIKKRFTRLAPSLASMIIAASVFYYFFLSPKELLIHLKSSFYSLIYFSNFYYMNFDFYNSPSNKYLTMLHTWSLSIEEQFYLLIPLFIYIILKFNKNINTSLTLFLCISLAINLIFYESQYLFYNPLARIWEFLLGAIYMLNESKLKNYKKLNFRYFGIFFIFISMYLYQDNFINNLLPKFLLFLGTILFLLDDNEKSAIINSSLLGLFGNISYSLYLFHQPLIAIFNIQNDKIEKLNNIDIFYFFIILLFISYVNWKLVEIKLHNPKYLKILLILYLLTIFILSLAIFDIPDDLEILNIPNKLFLLKIKEDNIVTQNGISCNNRSVSDTCKFVRDPSFKNIYVIGDSSLRTLTNSFLNDSRINNFNIIHFTGNDCIFIFGIHPSDNSCPNKTIQEKNQFGHDISNSIIIYGARFPRYFSGEGFDNGQVKEINDIVVIPNLKNEIEDTLNIFSKNNNTIFLVYPIPEQGWNVPELIYYKDLPRDSLIAYKSDIWYEREKDSRFFLDEIKNESILRIYPSEIFCEELLKNYCVGAQNGKLFYSDDDHLSLEGSNLLSEKIISKILSLSDRSS